MFKQNINAGKALSTKWTVKKYLSISTGYV